MNELEQSICKLYMIPESVYLEAKIKLLSELDVVFQRTTFDPAVLRNLKAENLNKPRYMHMSTSALENAGYSDTIIRSIREEFFRPMYLMEPYIYGNFEKSVILNPDDYEFDTERDSEGNIVGFSAKKKESGHDMYSTMYQNLAMRTASDKCRSLENAAMGLAGEAGECVDIIKKHLFHDHELDLEKLKYELGDVLWYVALMCTVTGISMGDVMFANISKLQNRYPDGFDPERSKHREEEEKS